MGFQTAETGGTWTKKAVLTLQTVQFFPSCVKIVVEVNTSGVGIPM